MKSHTDATVKIKQAQAAMAISFFRLLFFFTFTGEASSTYLSSIKVIDLSSFSFFFKFLFPPFEEVLLVFASFGRV